MILVSVYALQELFSCHCCYFYLIRLTRAGLHGIYMTARKKVAPGFTLSVFVPPHLCCSRNWGRDQIFSSFVFFILREGWRHVEVMGMLWSVAPEGVCQQALCVCSVTLCSHIFNRNTVWTLSSRSRWVSLLSQPHPCKWSSSKEEKGFCRGTVVSNLPYEICGRRTWLILPHKVT